jgi:energy-coupling factor transport system permease protein
VDILRSLPIGLYLEQPITWLHRLDPRVKLFWLLTFLLTPVQAHDLWRIVIVIVLLVLTFAAKIPLRVWKQQMGLLLLLGAMTFVIAAISPDGLNINSQPRRPIVEITNKDQSTGGITPEQFPLTVNTKQPTDYRYIVWKAGNITITRRSLELGLKVSTLIFTYIYAPTLYLLVTAPEEITASLATLSSPLRWLKIPTLEVVLTLTLALRFVPLVLEEIQNLVRAIRTRAIHWKRLGLKRTAKIWLLVAERLLDNLFTRAEQTANAMQVRGFTTADSHQVRWNPLKMGVWDLVLLGLLLVFWGVRLAIGSEF